MRNFIIGLLLGLSIGAGGMAYADGFNIEQIFNGVFDEGTNTLRVTAI